MWRMFKPADSNHLRSRRAGFGPEYIFGSRQAQAPLHGARHCRRIHLLKSRKAGAEVDRLSLGRSTSGCERVQDDARSKRISHKGFSGIVPGAPVYGAVLVQSADIGSAMMRRSFDLPSRSFQRIVATRCSVVHLSIAERPTTTGLIITPRNQGCENTPIAYHPFRCIPATLNGVVGACDLNR